MSAICDHKASETDQTVRRVPEAERGISAVVRLLYELWTTLDHSADAPDTQSAACSLACELLPIAGGSLDELVAALGGGRTGWFDEALSDRGVSLTLRNVATAQETYGKVVNQRPETEQGD